MLNFFQRIRNWLRTNLSKVHVPGYKPLTLYDFTKFYWHAIVKGNVTNRSAAVTFYLLTAFFPLLIFLFTLVPFIPIDGIQDSLLESIRKAMPTPDVFSFFEDVLKDLLLIKRKGLLSFSFILGIYFASNAVYAILNGLNSSYHINNRSRFFKQKLWSVIVLFALILLFLLSFVLSGATSLGIAWLGEKHILSGGAAYYVLYFSSVLLSALTFLFAISVLYNVANTDDKKWKFFSAGAVASTVLIFLMKMLFGWYLVSFNSYSKLYGSLGTGLAFLLFMYYVVLMLIIGFEMNTSLQNAFRKSQAANPSA